MEKNNNITKKSLFSAILGSKNLLDDAFGTVQEDVDCIEAICLNAIRAIRAYQARKETRLELLRPLDAEDAAPVRQELVDLRTPAEELRNINDTMALLSRRIAPAGLGRLVPQFSTVIQAEAWWTGKGGES